VSPPESVFTYTRQAGPTRYLFVINDRRQPGPQYQKWHVMLNALGRKPLEPLRDEGLAQDVSVTVPAGLTLYDVLQHRRLDAKPAGTHQQLAVHLEPGGAAVIAAFPRPMAKLDLTAPGRVAPGTEAMLSLRVLDDAGQAVPGRQLAEIRVTRPDGQSWPGIQRYQRIDDGRRSLPLLLRSPPSRHVAIGSPRMEFGLTAAARVVVD